MSYGSLKLHCIMSNQAHISYQTTAISYPKDSLDSIVASTYNMNDSRQATAHATCRCLSSLGGVVSKEILSGLPLNGFGSGPKKCCVAFWAFAPPDLIEGGPSGKTVLRGKQGFPLIFPPPHI